MERPREAGGRPLRASDVYSQALPGTRPPATAEDLFPRRRARRQTPRDVPGHQPVWVCPTQPEDRVGLGSESPVLRPGSETLPKAENTWGNSAGESSKGCDFARRPPHSVPTWVGQGTRAGLALSPHSKAHTMVTYSTSALSSGAEGQSFVEVSLLEGPGEAPVGGSVRLA